ncbi:MAG: hypothetical protein JWR26_2087 [Pedosphaera sp.]|nr:hypothetical protein [Pedosphaera sp.]
MNITLVCNIFLSIVVAAGFSVGTEARAQFANGGFESGAANTPPPVPWTVTTDLNPSFTAQTPETLAALDLKPGGVVKTVTLASASGPLTQTDPGLGPAASLRWPRFGNQCAIVNQQGSSSNVNSLSQTVTISAGSVDPSDGKSHIRFVVAPVLQNPNHVFSQQPYYFIQVFNITQNTVLYQDLGVSGEQGVPWKSINGGSSTEIDYMDWQLVDIAPGSAQMAFGDQVTLKIIASGCSLGSHYGQVYVDGVGATIPGISVEGTAPASAASNITYTLSCKNGAASSETGVVIIFNTPSNTTFQAVNSPSTVNSTPAVGAAGAVTCTFPGSLPAGASSSLSITVNINPGMKGSIVAGNYQIYSTQEPSPLFGPKINTAVLPSPPLLSGLTLLGTNFGFSFNDTPGSVFTVLTSTNVALPSGNWTVAGSMTEAPSGHFTFTDPQAATNQQRFYRVRSQ